MSDNDLVMRGVIKERMIARGWKHPDSTVTEFVEDDIPAVPQEMSAREYEKAFQRITYEDVETYRAWWEAIHDEDWERAVAIVEKWAREHPEERSEQ